MVIDFIIAAYAGIKAGSLPGFLLLLFLSVMFSSPSRPGSSGLLNLVLVLTGVSILLSLFGGGDSDWDL